MLLNYDGTWEGFLTCLWIVFKAKDWQANIVSALPQDELFRTVENDNIVTTSPEIASKIWERIYVRLGSHAALTMRCAFLNCAGDRENRIMRFLQRGLDLGLTCMERHNEPLVRDLSLLASAVRREVHRLEGFIRFQELTDKSLYAEISSEHCCLPLLEDHFSARLGGLMWMIHDTKRQLALVHGQGETRLIAGIRRETDIPLSANEKAYQALWQNFFTTIAIPGKTNPDLQAKLMPKRYWQNLVEKPGQAAI